MALYCYVKKDTRTIRKILHVSSYMLLITGAFFLFWSLYPIISFDLYSRVAIRGKMMSPIPDSQLASSLQKADLVLGTYQIFSTNLSDYTKAGVWFPQKPQNTHSVLTVKEYALSIPRLHIEKAKVLVGGDDLSNALIHYLPRHLPGEPGNVAIFGHSTLPQLYNNTNYKTIFTYLPSLQKGDKIYAYVHDKQYEYEIYDMFVVNPDEVSVLDQTYEDSYLTLVTCVPPGTYWKRLVVKAKLNQI